MLRLGLLLTALLALGRHGATVSTAAPASGAPTPDSAPAQGALSDAPVARPVALLPPADGDGTVAVYVDGVRPGPGEVVVWVFRSADGFPASRRHAYREVREAASSRSLTVILEDVPEGPVAVVAFHDTDGDVRPRRPSENHAGEGMGMTGGGTSDFVRAAVVVPPSRAAVARIDLQYP